MSAIDARQAGRAPSTAAGGVACSRPTATSCPCATSTAGTALGGRERQVGSVALAAMRSGASPMTTIEHAKDERPLICANVEQVA